MKHIRSEDKWDRVFELLERGSQEIIGDGWKSDLKDVTMSIDSGPHDETILGLIRMIRNTVCHMALEGKPNELTFFDHPLEESFP